MLARHLLETDAHIARLVTACSQSSSTLSRMACAVHATINYQSCRTGERGTASCLIGASNMDPPSEQQTVAERHHASIRAVLHDHHNISNLYASGVVGLHPDVAASVEAVVDGGPIGVCLIDLIQESIRVANLALSTGYIARINAYASDIRRRCALIKHLS